MNLPSFIEIVRSKKLMLSMLASYLRAIPLLLELRNDIKHDNSSSEPLHRRRMSSIYLAHSKIWGLEITSTTSYSHLAINKFAKLGAYLAPMATPLSCR